MKKRKVTMETLKKVAIDYVNNRADTHRLAYELNAYREQNPDADIKLAKKAELCLTREEAQKLIKKADKAQAKLDQ